jgi:transcriptional regulator with XRE-family HTH domain
VIPVTDVGKRIKRLRTLQNKSQRELACPGVSYAYISRIENGQRDPSYKALIKLADKLGTTAFYLATGRTTGVCPFCQT